MGKGPGYIFWDGRFLPATEARIARLTPGRIRGEGVFETMRALDGRIILSGRHLARMGRALSALGIRVGFSRREITNALQQVLKVNAFPDARLRLVVWRHRGACHTGIAVLPYRPYPEEKYRRGFQAVVSGRRIDEKAAPAVKSVRYRPFYQAYREAVAGGFDEAVLLNRSGLVAEGSRSNIFWVTRGVLMTPDLRCGCLDGITRRVVWELAGARKIKRRQVMEPLDAVDAAEEVFMTNSLMGIMPVTSLNRRKVGRGTRGPLTEALRHATREFL